MAIGFGRGFGLVGIGASLAFAAFYAAGVAWAPMVPAATAASPTAPQSSSRKLYEDRSVSVFRDADMSCVLVAKLAGGDFLNIVRNPDGTEGLMVGSRGFNAFTSSDEDVLLTTDNAPTRVAVSGGRKPLPGGGAVLVLPFDRGEGLQWQGAARLQLSRPSTTSVATFDLPDTSAALRVLDSCRARPTPSFAGRLAASPVGQDAGDAFAGYWETRNGATWSLVDIATGSPGNYAVIHKIVGPGGCMGTVRGLASPAGDTLNLRIPLDTNDACDVTYRKTATGLTVAESGCAAMHGVTCSFTGRLVRQAPASRSLSFKGSNFPRWWEGNGRLAPFWLAGDTIDYTAPELRPDYRWPSGWHHKRGILLDDNTAASVYDKNIGGEEMNLVYLERVMSRTARGIGKVGVIANGIMSPKPTEVAASDCPPKSGRSLLTFVDRKAGVARALAYMPAHPDTLTPVTWKYDPGTCDIDGQD